jgi:hypothetical protein
LCAAKLDIHSYLEEGHFDSVSDEDLQSKLNEKNAFECLEFWLNNYIYKPQGAYNTELPAKEVLALLNFIYSYLDTIQCDEEGNSDQFASSTESLYFDQASLDELFKLDNALINKLPEYYPKGGGDEIVSYEPLRDMSHFVNLEYSSRNLSSGETAMLNLFSRISNYFTLQTIEKGQKYLLLLDEADLGFHPEWKKKFISTLIPFVQGLFKEIGSTVQIIFTTHDPLTLSDILNYNITYLTKDGNSEKYDALKYDAPSRPQKSFGANITELLADSFFINNGLTGEFASTKINETITWLNEKEDKVDKDDYHKRLIENIGEPIIRRKLAEMYSDKMPKDLSKQVLEQEIKILQERLDNHNNSKR